jgi:alpha-mannosidase
MQGGAPAKRRVHMMGNAHIDPAWVWRWSEGWQEAAATVESALNLLDEFPDFIVTRGESALYEWLEQSHPDLIERIKPHVKSGRWQIVGGWVVQADCNMPSGESFIRQALLGKRYFRERFDVEVDVAYSVDAFGHAATLPALFAGCGYKYYVMMRPMKHEMALPSDLFRWRAPDGSEILTFRIPGGYVTAAWRKIADHLANVLPEAPAEVDSTLCPYGVGNHGGGPTREHIRQIIALQDRKDIEVLFSSCRAFFDEVSLHRNKLPVVASELNPHSIGCYTAVSELKRMMRQSECALLDAETIACLAWRQDRREVPADVLNAAWRDVLFNQFHDILAGTAILSASEDAVQQLGGARQRALSVQTAAGLRLARHIEVRPPHGAISPRSVVVLNPTGIERREVIRFNQGLFKRLPEQICLADGSGNRIPAQHVFCEGEVFPKENGLAASVHLPPFGYAAYHVIEGESASGVRNPVRVRGLQMSNGRIRATIDPATGGLASLKGEDGTELLAGPMQHQIVPDLSDTWTHNALGFGEPEASFELTDPPFALYRGPLTAEIRTVLRWQEARLIQEYVLDADSAFLTVRSYLDWRGTQKLVRFNLPLADAQASVAEIPHGWCRRPCDSREYPMQRWVACGGLVVANDSKYGYRVKDGGLGITVLRSPVYTHHQPTALNPVRRHDWTDQGHHRYTFRLMPCGPFDPAKAHDLADGLNRPLIVNPDTLHDGPLGPCGSLLPVVCEGVRAVALKKAESSDRLILRLLDVSGKGGTARLGDTTIATLKPHQILTLSLDPKKPARKPRVVNHIELTTQNPESVQWA